MLNSKSIGNKIAETRKKKKLSQAELAQQVSISPQAVGKWERGESMPDITTLHRIAEIFGVDLNYFSDSFQEKENTIAVTNQFESQAIEIPEIKTRKKNDWNWDMSQGNWTDADFSGLKNLKEKFSSSNMKNCQFRNSDLSGLILANNNIELCDFTSSDLRNSKIQSSNVLNSRFDHCSLIDAQFMKNNIEKCNFTEANFSGSEFNGSNFEHNIIQQAVWKYTSFKKTNLSHMVFEGLIEDCHFEQCGFYSVKFEHAMILNTFFKYNDKFKKVQFINCKVDNITLAFLKNNQANLEGITLLTQQEIDENHGNP